MFFKLTKPTSVFFFSLHKCATSYFSSSVLPNAAYHKQVSYQNLMYHNHPFSIDIQQKGIVYGVIRIVKRTHPSFQISNQLVEHASNNDYPIIVLVRDPRDILVSMYFSFGFTHGFSPNPKIKKYQKQRMEEISSKTIDEFASEECYSLREKFETLLSLLNHPKAVLLRYEDLIDNYEKFYFIFESILPLKNRIRKRMFDDTRPRTYEDQSKHKRKGNPGDFSVKLKAETITHLNGEFSDIIPQFEYDMEN